MPEPVVKTLTAPNPASSTTQAAQATSTRRGFGWERLVGAEWGWAVRSDITARRITSSCRRLGACTELSIVP